ncbi:MAG: hypothetical protein AB1457_16150 [Chloroflexota bacterium]
MGELEVMEAEVMQIKPFGGEPAMRSEGAVDSVLMSGGALQQTRTAYTTAVSVQQPRSIAKIAHNVLEEAKLAGKSFYYRWIAKTKDGKKSIIQGPSIDLAMALCRHYGNCAIDVQAVETPTHYMMKGVFIDLESGFTCPRLFRQRKGQSMGMKDQDRQEDIVFQIGQSKAIRNAVIKAMPDWLIERAIEVAGEAELNKAKAENPHLARQKVIEFFGGYGVTVERIEAERERRVDEWTADDIVTLRGMAMALKEGRVSPDELFPQVDPKTNPKEAAQTQKQNKAPKVSEQAKPGSETKQQKQGPPDEGHYTAEELKDLKNLQVAIQDFPNEYQQALKELGMTQADHSPEDAKRIIGRINSILDSQAF